MMSRLKLIFDGAFGTYYRAVTVGRAGGNPDDSDIPCELAVLDDPETVRWIHLEYLRAGANAISCDTFAANPLTIPDRKKLGAVVSAAFRIASSACRDYPERGAEVFADIGGIPASNPAELISDAYLEVAKLFLAEGASNFIFETADDFAPMLPAISYVRSAAPDSYIAVSFAVSQDGYTSAGRYYADLFEEALRYADLIGLNCVCGPAHICRLLEALPESLSLERQNILAMPNSSYPVKVSGRLEYHDNPEYFSERMTELVSRGLYALGGCCGTTPRHIKLTCERVAGLKDAPETVLTPPKLPSSKASPVYSRLRDSIDRGDFVCLAELDPPLDSDASFIIGAAAEYRNAGASAVTVADSPLARSRADSFAISAKLRREVGIDALPHLSCRDRNSIAIKGTLLAANIENVSNVLCVTGDSANGGSGSGDRQTNVYSFNSTRLISFVNSLNSEVFAARPFTIFAALNVNAVNFSAELSRALKKYEAGAKILLTQALFTDESFENLRRARAELPGDCRIMAGILPVAGYKNAVFLTNEVAGITVPDSLIEALRDKTPEEAREISIEFSKRQIDRVKPLCDGIYLMTPLKRVSMITELIKYVKDCENKCSKSEKN